MAQITVARALAKLLEKMGTEVVFGVNGHGNWALLDALVNETRIRGVPARAEDHAVQMADGYWRMRRAAPLAEGIDGKKRRTCRVQAREAVVVEAVELLPDLELGHRDEGHARLDPRSIGPPSR